MSRPEQFDVLILGSGTQDRGMLRPGELQTVQQAILDRVHY
jgi:hypothetical protein